jgi:hypothetical protein
MSALQNLRLQKDLATIRAAMAESAFRAEERREEIKNIEKTLEVQKANELEILKKIKELEGSN